MLSRIIVCILIISLICFLYVIDRESLLDQRDSEYPFEFSLIRLLENKEFLGQCQHAFMSLPLHHQKRIAKLINDEQEMLGSSRTFPSEIVFPTADYQNSLSVKTMNAVYLFSPVRITVPLEIPRKALLSYSYSFPRCKPGSDSKLHVVCRERYSGNILMQHTIRLSGKSLHTWYDVQLSINNMSRGIIDFEFYLPDTDTAPVEIMLGNPIFHEGSSTSNHLKSPNIVLISLDAFRADHLGCYGYHRQTTPILDRLSKQSVLFMKAFSQSGFTIPSHKSMLSGLYPQIFEYYSNSRFAYLKKLLDGIPLVSKDLKVNGYNTIAFTGSGSMSRIFGFWRDFDTFTEQLFEPKEMNIGIDGRTIKESGFGPVIEWLEKSSVEPFFLFFHTYGIHSPYAAPRKYDLLFNDETSQSTTLPKTISSQYLSEFNKNSVSSIAHYPESDRTHIINCYDRGIRWIDNEMIRLLTVLDKLSLLEKTVVIVTSDHGEEFLEHGRFEHSMLYKQTLHVPFLIRFPGFRKQTSIISKTVELVHLVPTIHDLVGYETERKLHGESFLPLLTGEENHSWQEERPIFASLSNWVSVQFKGHKYHLKNEPELYNIVSDPLELNNLWTEMKNTCIKKDLLYRALYYIAENHPGNNILMTENENIHNVRLKNISITKNAAYDKGNKYIFENDDAGIYVNQIAVHTIKTPALFTFEPSDDKDYILTYKLRTESQESEKFAYGFTHGKSICFVPKKILVTDKNPDTNDQRMSTLHIESSEPPGDNPTVQEGLNIEDIHIFDGFVWKTDLDIRSHGHSPADIIDEELTRTLEALGYIQGETIN